MKYAVSGKRLKTLPQGAAPNWADLLREFCSQAVCLQAFDVLSELKDQLPDEFYQKSDVYARRLTANNMRAEHAQSEVVRVLEQEKCPYVILKGETVAVTYPIPELRLLGDVDFLVPAEHVQTIVEKMKALGYTHTWEPGDHHHILDKKGACLELHVEVAGMPKGKTREDTQNFLSSIYEDSILLDRGMGPFRAPSGAHQAMVLILHMQHHVVELGMGLRHIMDWACFVNHTAKEDFWQSSLLPVLKKIGLLHFTAVVTKMASLYLGSYCPSWAAYAEESLCRDLMEDILAGGNFGRKDEERSRALNMLPDWEKTEAHGKLKLLYRTLRTSVLREHPELEKKPLSVGVHMVGKAGRYVVLYCQGKRPNLVKAASHADTRRSVYERLRMFETEK